MTTRILTIVLLLTSLLGVSTAGAAQTEGPVSDAQVFESRPDIAALIYAAAAEMRGLDGNLPEVTFTPAARAGLRADGFNYDGFGSPRFTLMRCAESDANPAQTEVGVVMVFSDALMRRAHLSVLLTCTWNADGKHITVDSATVDRVTPPEPQMVLTIVPANRVPEDIFEKYTHAELLPWIIDNRATDAEFAAGDADDCYLFAFVYDRLNPGATLGILVSDEPAGATGDAGSGVDYPYAGWHLAVLRGTFNWKGDDTFYVKVVRTQSSTPDAPQLIGILSSQLETVDYLGRPISSGWLMGLSDGIMQIVAGVLVGLGVLVALLGYKMGRAFLALAGLVVGGLAGIVGTQPLLLGELSLPNMVTTIITRYPVLLLVAALVSAGVVMIVFAAAQWIARLVLGAAIGAAIGIAITGDPANFTSPVVLVAAGMLGLFGMFAKRLFTILFSAAAGAALLAVGIGQWFGTVELRAWQPGRLYPACGDWTTGQLSHWLKALHGPPLVVLVIAIAAFVVGAVLQLLTTRHKPEPEAAPPADTNYE